MKSNIKKNTNLEPKKLSIKEIRCPYCRKVHSSLLPQIKGFAKISGVNSPEKYCMYLSKCPYRDKNNIICTFHYHEQSIVRPNFWCKEKGDKWIVYPWEVQESEEIQDYLKENK